MVVSRCEAAMPSGDLLLCLIAEEGKIAVKDSKKLNRKLLHDAEKERAKKLFADFGSYLSATEDKKTALEICGAVAGL
eukprot:1343828-Rhodomonas_salina.1